MLGADVWSSWGQKSGPLRLLDPTIRIVCFVIMFAAVLIPDPFRWWEAGTVVLMVVLWVGFSGLDAKRVAKLSLLGAILFLPAFLLAPWIGGGEPLFWLPIVGVVTENGVAVPTRIVIRGLACLLLGAGLVATTDATGLGVGLSRLPIPRILVVMTVQILRWVGVLLEETLGIARAIRLRGAGRGLGQVWLLLRSVPLVWVPRVAARADRVACAMEIRGYRGQLPDGPKMRFGRVDAVGLMMATSLLLLSLLVGSS